MQHLLQEIAALRENERFYHFLLKIGLKIKKMIGS